MGFHGTNLASRVDPGNSYHVYMWAGINKHLNIKFKARRNLGQPRVCRRGGSRQYSWYAEATCFARAGRVANGRNIGHYEGAKSVLGNMEASSHQYDSLRGVVSAGWSIIGASRTSRSIPVNPRGWRRRGPDRWPIGAAWLPAWPLPALWSVMRGCFGGEEEKQATAM